MHARERRALSLVFGVLAVALPAAVWAYIVRTSLRDAQAFHDQGGMFISFILFPLAMLVWLACAVPAIVLLAGGLARSNGRSGAMAWRVVAASLSALGMLLALGTCIGPEVLAEALR